jgi:transcriptional regulator with XRE-family HTH domain
VREHAVHANVRAGKDAAVLTEPGTWLRQQRQARSWAVREMARRLIQAGHTAGDMAMPSLDSMSTYVRRWEHGQYTLTERYKLHYCTALGISPGQFGLAPLDAALVSPVRAGPRLPAALSVAYRGTCESDLGRFMVEREVLMTAHESSDHAEQAEQPGIGEATIDQLRADVVRLSHLSDTGEPFAAFLEMRRIRNRIYRLLERRIWPREQTDLYFLLGALNGLMGIASYRLGYPDAAEELHRAGWAYANAIDHRPLMARSRSELAEVAYFRGRFEESRDLALSGLEYLRAGPEGAHLHIKHAHAAARLGDAEAARRAVRDAHEARDRHRDYTDDLLDIGGEYAISRATHSATAGAALTAMAGAEDEAAAELERAIELYDEGPGEHEEYWYAGEPLAGIGLAVVRLRSGALEAAAAALEPAFSLPATQRITDLTTRLALAREELAAPIFRGSPQARALGEQIEEFGRETIAAGLHSLPGGPG